MYSTVMLLPLRASLSSAIDVACGNFT